MTDIIAVAKHYGLDSDPNKKYNRFTKEIDDQTTKKSKRKVIYGTGLEHIIGMSINTDRHINRKFKIKPVGDTNVEINKKYFEERDPTIFYSSFESGQTGKDLAIQNIKDHIKDNAKMVLFGNMTIPDNLINGSNEFNLYYYLKILNDGFKNRNNLTENYKELESALLFFELNGIPFYKLIRWIQNSLAIKDSVSGVYLNSTGVDLDSNYISSRATVFKNMSNVVVLAYLLKDSKWREAFNKKYKDKTLLINFIDNVDDLDDTLYLVDGSGNKLSLRTIESILTDEDKALIKNAFDDENIQIALDQKNSVSGEEEQETVEQIKVQQINYIRNEVKEELKNTNEEVTSSYEQTVEQLTQELVMLFGISYKLDKTEQENKAIVSASKKKTYTEKVFAQPRINRILSISTIIEHLKDISKLNNEIVNKQNKAVENEEKIRLLIAKQNELQSLIIQLESNKTWFENKKDLVNNVEFDINKTKEIIEQAKDKALGKALVDNIGYGLFYLTNKDNFNLGVGNINKPKYITDELLTNYSRDQKLAFANEITLLKNLIDPSNKKYFLKNMYEFIKENDGEYRLVVLVPPDDDEGLYKTISDRIRRYDPLIDDPIYANKKKFDFSKLKFKNMTELVNHQEKGGKVVFDGVVYEGIDKEKINNILRLDLSKHRNLTPTYKEYEVKSLKDLEDFYENVINNDLIAGFVTRNTFVSSVEKIYNPIRYETAVDKAIFALQLISKNMSKFTVGFLTRNLVDTIYQITTEGWITPRISNAKQDHFHTVLTSMELYRTYKFLSEEHTITIANAGLYYEKLLEQSKLKTINIVEVNKNVDYLKELLESYVKIGNNIKNQKGNGRIKYRVILAKSLLDKLSGLSKISNPKELNVAMYILKRTINFIAGIEFGEFVELYDNKKINDKWVAGLRVDSRDKNNNVISTHESINDKLDTKPFMYKLFSNFAKKFGIKISVSNQDHIWKKQMLKQLSAFMNTSALNDIYKTNRFELLPKFFEKYKGYNGNSRKEYTYEDIKKKVNSISSPFKNGNWINPMYWVNEMTNAIETGARVTNFFISMQVYGKSFDEATNNSLMRWFNYGLRTPFERRLMADMPFISFPVRSISNWVDRLVNPRYWRISAKLIDGIYGQYIDPEEKEYDDFTKFQMSAGWIPITKNFGIRLGNGALDVMGIIYGLDKAIVGRRSPILNAISQFATNQNLKEVPRLLDTAIAGGIFNRLSKVPSAGLTPSLLPTALYNINTSYKFSPKRYRYDLYNNGRYAKYENIYKDWFTKYGKMKKPTVNPYQLVKNIQWRQYVRYRRSRNVIR
jgi:hypothetical protein